MAASGTYAAIRPGWWGLFVCGSALETWIDETLPDNQLFADASVLAEEWPTAELPWRDVIRATRTVTVTCRELYDYVQTLE